MFKQRTHQADLSEIGAGLRARVKIAPWQRRDLTRTSLSTTVDHIRRGTGGGGSSKAASRRGREDLNSDLRCSRTACAIASTADAVGDGSGVGSRSAGAGVDGSGGSSSSCIGRGFLSDFRQAGAYHGEAYFGRNAEFSEQGQFLENAKIL